jgi:hypothetical protein
LGPQTKDLCGVQISVDQHVPWTPHWRFIHSLVCWLLIKDGLFPGIRGRFHVPQIMPGNQQGLHVPHYIHIFKNLDYVQNSHICNTLQITCQIHLLISKVLQNPLVRLEMRPKEWRYQ